MTDPMRHVPATWRERPHMHDLSMWCLNEVRSCAYSLNVTQDAEWKTCQPTSSFTGLNTVWETLRPTSFNCCAYPLSRSRVSEGEPMGNEYRLPFLASNRKAVGERVRTLHPWASAATTIALSSRSNSLCSTSIIDPRRDGDVVDTDCDSACSLRRPSLAILFRMAVAAGPIAACRFWSLRLCL